MSDVSLNKTTFDICLILCRNIGHVTSVLLNDMLLWIIPYLHICTIAPISIFVVTQRGSVSIATTIQPIGGRVNWTNHGGVFLHRSISLGRSRSRLRSLWLLLLHWILCLAFFFETDIRWRSCLCDLRKSFGPRRVLDPWISPTSIPIGFYPDDVTSVHSSSRGLLNFHTVLSSNSPTYTVLPSGVTVISCGSWNPWKKNHLRNSMISATLKIITGS